MNQAIKDGLNTLEYWAQDSSVYSNKQLTAVLYPVYREYVPGQTGDINRHFLTHVRVDYNYVTVGEQLNVPGVLRIVVMVEAHRHHNELICYCKAGKLPAMTLSTLQYLSTIIDVFRDNVLELLRRARGVLHHWTQLLSAPYAILEMSAQYNEPSFSYSDEEPISGWQAPLMNDGTPVDSTGRRRRPRLPAFGQTGLQE